MGNEIWAAPVAAGPVIGTVNVPGSKSITNRAFVLAALSEHRSTIFRPLLARDTRLMLAALASLGTEIHADNDAISITPHPFEGPASIDCGLAGTVMRFAPPLASLAIGSVCFDGDPGARGRPLAETISSLRSLGVSIDDAGHGGLPFSIAGIGRVPGGEVVLDASRSSQFVSGLLLSAARYERGAQITHAGAPLPSLPHIEMTLSMIRAAGVSAESDLTDPTQASWSVTPGLIDLGNIAVEPDLSNAAVFLAAAMVTGGSVTVPGWPGTTIQAGDQIREVFSGMGGTCELAESGLTVTGPAELTGIDIDLRDIGELTPTVAAVAVFAATASRLRGIAHLRGHETNRLAALATEINRAGGRVSETDDGLIIEPAQLHAADLHSYHDHRMATFAAIVGLVVPGIGVQDIATTIKTLPDFAGQWRALIGSEAH